jgi:hypothetical protein
MFITLQQIVNYFQDACQQHLYVNSFAFGSIDYLDASSQNVEYPYVYLRPMTSVAYNKDTKLRTLSFELYCLDVPKLSNQSPLEIMSRTETVLYDLGSYFEYGPPSNDQALGYMFRFTNIVPALEAFNDRAYGWMGNIEIETMGLYDYCSYPKL